MRGVSSCCSSACGYGPDKVTAPHINNLICRHSFASSARTRDHGERDGCVSYACISLSFATLQHSKSNGKKQIIYTQITYVQLKISAHPV